MEIKENQVFETMVDDDDTNLTVQEWHNGEGYTITLSEERSFQHLSLTIHQLGMLEIAFAKMKMM